jgi:glycosyltransferase involved in cell wall biosynthesis
VVPTLDRPDLLRRCLSSVLHGNRQPDQVVVCDQSKGAQTSRLVEEIARRYVCVRYVHLDWPHTSRARNAGLAAARTDLVAFIDDDCVAHRGWLEALSNVYAEASRMEDEACRTVSAVAGSVLPLYGGPGRRGHAIAQRAGTMRRYFRGGSVGMKAGHWAPWDVGTGANIISARRLLLAAGGFDEELGPGSRASAAEDIDLIYRLARAGTLVYEPGAVVYHPTKDRWGRLRSRFAYGRGMGAMLARHAAAGEGSARTLLLLYGRHQLASMLRGGAWGPVESILTLAGTGRALVGAWARGE